MNSCKASFHLLLFITVTLFTIKSKARASDTLWINCAKNCKYADFYPYTSSSVKAVWKGGCLNGYAHGKGRLEKYYDNKLTSVFEGSMNKGLMQGPGTYNIIDQNKYTGTFNNGRLTGNGKVISEDFEYTGNLINFSIHGMGVMNNSNGVIEEGFFVHGSLLSGKSTSIRGDITYYKDYNVVDEPYEPNNKYNPAIGVRVTEFFDEDWKLCSKANASYYRMVTYKAPNVPSGKVKDFYISGVLQNEFEALYLNSEEPQKNFYHGENNFYYETGVLSSHSSYTNNSLSGTMTRYYESGKKKSTYDYDYGVLNGPNIFYDELGNIQRYIFYEDGEKYNGSTYDFDDKQICTATFNEVFSKNKSSWTYESGKSFSKVTDTGSVFISINDKSPLTLYNSNNVSLDYDFGIAIGLRKTSGDETPGYGMIMGYEDENNYSLFLISEFGSYSIVKIENGKSTTLQEWTHSDYIKKNNQFNRLYVLRHDDEYQFYINGEYLMTTSGISMTNSNIGFVSYSQGNFLIEYLYAQNQFNKEISLKFLDDIEGKKESTTTDWTGSGSGFFIDQRGYIATNYHVVKDATDIQVEFFQKGEKLVYKAEMTDHDEQNDVAILKINDKNFKPLPPIPYVFTTNLRDLGTDVFTLGYPLSTLIGEGIKFTDGKISSKSGPEGSINMYQISVPIQPGNSGGPLFDNRGNLVGITSSKLKKEYNAENVNFAIKSTYLKNLIDMNNDNIVVPKYVEIYNKKLTEKIKLISDFIPIIKVK